MDGAPLRDGSSNRRRGDLASEGPVPVPNRMRTDTPESVQRTRLSTPIPGVPRVFPVPTHSPVSLDPHVQSLIVPGFRRVTPDPTPTSSPLLSPDSTGAPTYLLREWRRAPDTHVVLGDVPCQLKSPTTRRVTRTGSSGPTVSSGVLQVVEGPLLSRHTLRRTLDIDISRSSPRRCLPTDLLHLPPDS